MRDWDRMIFDAKWIIYFKGQCYGIVFEKNILWLVEFVSEMKDDIQIFQFLFVF